MVVTIDIKNTNLSRVSVFSGGSTAGGGGGSGNRKIGSGGGVLEDMDGYLTLSYKQRLIGFLCCLVAGALIIGLVCVSQFNLFTLTCLLVIYKCSYCQYPNVCNFIFLGKCCGYFQVNCASFMVEILINAYL